MADLTQLRTWLSEALSARHKIMTGTQAVTLAYEGRSVSYNQANLDALNAYINDLNAQIAAAGGGGLTRSAIGIVF